MKDRGLETGQIGVLGDGRSIIINPMGHPRPPVVLSFLHQIKFVSAPGAVFGGPEFIRAGTEGQGLRVAVPGAPDGVQSLVAEGIVLRHGPVLVHPMDFSIGAVQVLGLILTAPVANGKIDISVPEDDTGAEMNPSGTPEYGVGLIHGLGVSPGVPIDAAAHHGGDGILALSVTEGQIDPAVFLNFRMHRHIEHASLSLAHHVRSAFEGWAQGAVRLQHAHRTVDFGDNRGAVREKGYPPHAVGIVDHLLQAVGQLVGIDHTGPEPPGRFALCPGLQFPQIDDHGTDFFFAQHIRESLHAHVGQSVTDHLCPGLIIGAVLIVPVHQ